MNLANNTLATNLNHNSHSNIVNTNLTKNNKNQLNTSNNQDISFGDNSASNYFPNNLSSNISNVALEAIDLHLSKDSSANKQDNSAREPQKINESNLPMQTRYELKKSSTFGNVHKEINAENQARKKEEGVRDTFNEEQAISVEVLPIFGGANTTSNVSRRHIEGVPNRAGQVTNASGANGLVNPEGNHFTDSNIIQNASNLHFSSQTQPVQSSSQECCCRVM